jgi:hypothetical protein
MMSLFKGKLLSICMPFIIIGIFIGFFWLTRLLLQMNTDFTYVVLGILLVILQFDWGKMVKRLRDKSS